MKTLQEKITDYFKDFIPSLFTKNDKCWVFKSNKILNSTELNYIYNQFNIFGASWNSHGHKIISWLGIAFDSLLIITAKQNNFIISGCAQDKLFRFTKQLYSDMNINFLDRLSIDFIDNELNIKSFSLNQLKNNSGLVENFSEYVFNTNPIDLEDLKYNSIQKYKDSFIYKNFVC